MQQVSGSHHSSGSESPPPPPPRVDDVVERSQKDSPQTSILQHDTVEGTGDVDDPKMQADYSGADPDETSQRSAELLHGASHSVRRPTVWGRAPVSSIILLAIILTN